jgi:hypothetical protein
MDERFWLCVNKDGPVVASRPDLGPCWPWTGHLFHDGYGRFDYGGRADKTAARAHRISYAWLKGEIPDGLIVDHLCHTHDSDCPGGKTCPHRRCVNPDHLEAVTQRVNVLRGVGISALNAAKTHCPRNHPYDEANTRTRGGSRHCRTCDRIQANARYAAKKKAAALVSAEQ